MTFIPLSLEDGENADFLKHPEVHFEITRKGKVVGTADLEKGTIETKDSELEDYF